MQVSCELGFSIEQLISGLLFPSIVAVIAWMLTQAVLGPIQDVYKVRREVLENLTFFANVYPVDEGTEITPEVRAKWNQEWEEARPELRRLASKLKAHSETLEPWRTWIISQIHPIDFEKAGDSLIGLSNTYDRRERALIVNEIEKTLCFKRTLSDKTIEKIKVRADWG